MTRAGWLLAGGAALLAAGCGQKGALYLPDKNAQVVTTPPPPTSVQPPPAQPPPAPPASESAPAPQAAPVSTSPAPPKPGDRSEDSETPK